MQARLHDYKQHINDALDRYEALFSEDSPMSTHRANDVLAIRQFVHHATTPRALKQAWINFRKTIKTGLWVGDFTLFSTGDSQLKSELDKAMKHPRYTLEVFRALASVDDVLAENAQLTAAIARHERQTVPVPAASRSKRQGRRADTDCEGCCTRDREIEHLQLNLERLTASNERLMSENLQEDGQSGSPLTVSYGHSLTSFV